LEEIGLTVFEEELQALWFGVAQLRPRVFVVGIRNPTNSLEVRRPMSVRNATVRDAIGSLSAPAFFRRGIDPDTIPLHRNHWTMNPKSKRFAAPEKVSSSTRSFKRLRWDYPSPTVAYGHREIHVHPTGTRRLSVFEAMRLQGFPDRYVLEGNLSEQVTQVSNAVSPPVAFAIAQAISRSRSAQGE
jgi:DNA (cytosine-5)-methyltransferase 1